MQNFFRNIYVRVQNQVCKQLGIKKVLYLNLYIFYGKMHIIQFLYMKMYDKHFFVQNLFLMPKVLI